MSKSTAASHLRFVLSQLLCIIGQDHPHDEADAHFDIVCPLCIQSANSIRSNGWTSPSYHLPLIDDVMLMDGITSFA